VPSNAWQAEAIAVNMREMSRLPVPDRQHRHRRGRLGRGAGHRRCRSRRDAPQLVVLGDLPRGCAAILWKQANEQTNTAAADALKLTANDNLALGIVDGVIDEPLGGAHRDPDGAAKLLEAWIASALDDLVGTEPKALMEARYQRFRKLGAFEELAEAEPANAP
jgi:acetyl-CoA carboxylase carboxyl transferase subunit alpha